MSHLLSRGASLVLFAVAVLVASAAHAVSTDIVISQVYGGGGNSGAPLTNDFVELFNRGTAPVSIGGWSIQYASATGTGNFGSNSGQIAELPDVFIEPGRYFLIQLAGGSTGSALPAADLIDSTPINMSGTSGKVALARIATTLGCNGGSTPCSAAQVANIVDLVGYGGANFFETSPAPGLGNTTAAFRAEGGCVDTDNNAADFSEAAPAPRNSSSAPQPCGGDPSLSVDDVTVVEGESGTTIASFTVSLSAPAPAGGVSFEVATADNTATIANNDYISNVAVGHILAGQQSYAFDVVVNGDETIEPNEEFFVNISNPVGAVVLGKAQGIGTITNDDFAPPVFDVVISQVYGGGGNSGARFTNDFVELFNRGTSTVSINGWSVQYASSGGSSWQVTPLEGSIPPGGYYLVQQAAGSGGTTALPDPDATGGIAMAGGSGKVALRSTTTALSGSCPAGATIVDMVGYGSASCFEGSAPANGLSNSTAALRQRGGCSDTNDNRADFFTGTPTPRNSSTPARSCVYIPLAINQIQGSELASPYAGQDVSTTGIVTAEKNNGFFLQTADGGADSNPATSEALFVFTTSTPTVDVAVGDFVTVKGTATEFFDLTQIESRLPGEITVHSSGLDVPAAVTLTASMLNPAGPIHQLEHLEGMRVSTGSLVSVAPTNGFGEIVTVFSGVARPMREPGIEAGLDIPADPETGVVDCCIPVWDGNPERLMIDSEGLAGAPFLNVTSNTTILGVTGPLDYAFGDYKILPESVPQTTGGMSAVPVSAAQPGDFRVAGFNIEHFTGNATQRRKAALAIRDVLRYPDVIAHVEIGSLAALESLAAQINDDAAAAGDPNPGYEARLIPFGTGTQHIGFLVKTSRVQIDSVTQHGADELFVNPSGTTSALHDRPPLVLRATVGRWPVILVGVHNRSFIDVELLDDEGTRVRAKRTLQAESLARLLQELQTSNPNTPVIVLGDYNAFQFNDGYTDPVSIIKGSPTAGDEIVVTESPDLVDPNFVNLTDSLDPEQQYTFIFEGTPQALDHVIVNAASSGYVRRYEIARNNADFPEFPASLFAGDATRPERASDHDMPVASFRFPSIAGLSVDKPVLGPVNHKMVDVMVSYTPVDRCGTVTGTLSVSSNEPENGSDDGNTAPDWEILDGHRLRLRAERSGEGTGRVYTITVTLTDSCGLVTTDQVTVSVPLNHGR